MGTRYEDQPTEQWAGPESLDPTPVWKQYALVALLLVVGLVVVVIVAVAALEPQFATPPQVVSGDRLVLGAKDVPAVGEPPVRIELPGGDQPIAFWLTQPAKGQFYALLRTWTMSSVGPCSVDAMGSQVRSRTDERTFIAACPGGHAPTFGADGHSFDAGVRGLDQYLVSVTGDRIIVNLSRIIRSDDRTFGPVPTGIPTPQATP